MDAPLYERERLAQPDASLQFLAFARVQARLLTRRRAFWVTLVVGLLMTVLAWVGFFEQQIDGIGFGGGQTPKNSMYALADYMTPEVGLTCVLCIFFVAGAALFDRRQRVDGLVFSRPVSSLRYTLGHIIMLIGSVLAILAMEYVLALAFQPWLAQALQYDYIRRVEVFWPYIQLYVVTAVPCAFFFTSVAWLLATISQRILVAFAPLCSWWVLVYDTPGGLGANLFTYLITTDMSASTARTPVAIVETSQMHLGQWLDPSGVVYAREVWGQALNRAFHEHRIFFPTGGLFRSQARSLPVASSSLRSA